jgi:hypothetical protein
MAALGFHLLVLSGQARLDDHTGDDRSARLAIEPLGIAQKANSNLRQIMLKNTRRVRTRTIVFRGSRLLGGVGVSS